MEKIEVTEAYVARKLELERQVAVLSQVLSLAMYDLGWDGYALSYPLEKVREAQPLRVRVGEAHLTIIDPSNEQDADNE